VASASASSEAVEVAWVSAEEASLAASLEAEAALAAMIRAQRAEAGAAMEEEAEAEGAAWAEEAAAVEAKAAEAAEEATLKAKTAAAEATKRLQAAAAAAATDVKAAAEAAAATEVGAVAEAVVPEAPATQQATAAQVSSLGDAKSSLGDAKSSLGDAESSLGDAKSSLGYAHRWPRWSRRATCVWSSCPTGHAWGCACRRLFAATAPQPCSCSWWIPSLALPPWSCLLRCARDCLKHARCDEEAGFCPTEPLHAEPRVGCRGVVAALLGGHACVRRGCAHDAADAGRVARRAAWQISVAVVRVAVRRGHRRHAPAAGARRAAERRRRLGKRRTLSPGLGGSKGAEGVTRKTAAACLHLIASYSRALRNGLRRFSLHPSPYQECRALPKTVSASAGT
jgi:hypothetical protein